MSEIRDKRVELILQQLESLPTLPAIALRVLEATSADDTDLKDVVELISSDPSLTTRILQLVHRADLGVRGEVTSIERAVMLLGFEAVRSAVLAVSVFQVFQPSGKAINTQFSREEFWKHCLAVACCCELLAARIKSFKSPAPAIDPSEAFVCGLLHDLGKVALDAALPKSFSRVVEAAELLRTDIADIERQVIGLDHLVVGKRLAERWQLPASTRDAIWLHGQMPTALPATVRNPRLVNLVTLADQIVREQHLGFSGNYSSMVPEQVLLVSLGLTRDHLDKIVGQLVEMIEPRAKALGLGQTNTSELYQEALAQANRELGRVSAHLAAKNRKLATRAKFFDALAGFQAELRPDAQPSVVLHAIGQTAIMTLNVTSAAIFSLPPGRDYAEAILVDSSGQIFERTVVEVSAAAQQSMLGSHTDGPVLAVGAELEWFLGAVSPRLGADHRYWIRLEADNQTVGGVVWGAQVGEAQRLSTQVQELTAMSSGWSLALRTAQIRDEARALSEQLAEANRQLQNAQNEILRSRTVLTVGEMAAGAAHEMNNPLAVISGRSQLLATQLEDAKARAAAHLIHEQADRLSEIITELMDFAKPQQPKLVDSDLSELVNRALHEAKMHSDPVDRKFEVTIGDVPNVTIDPSQVGAALVEVLDNAIHATDPATGVIHIHAAYDPYSMRVVLSVTDSGCGMDEMTLKRAFDPFFSAKPAGRRRGMGLPKALRWVESSGGSMRMESHLGQGTRTALHLPAARAADVTQPAPLRKNA